MQGSCQFSIKHVPWTSSWWRWRRWITPFPTPSPWYWCSWKCHSRITSSTTTFDGSSTCSHGPGSTHQSPPGISLPTAAKYIPRGSSEHWSQTTLCSTPSESAVMGPTTFPCILGATPWRLDHTWQPGTSFNSHLPTLLQSAAYGTSSLLPSSSPIPLIHSPVSSICTCRSTFHGCCSFQPTSSQSATRQREVTLEEGEEQGEGGGEVQQQGGGEGQGEGERQGEEEQQASKR